MKTKSSVHKSSRCSVLLFDVCNLQMHMEESALTACFFFFFTIHPFSTPAFPCVGSERIGFIERSSEKHKSVMSYEFTCEGLDCGNRLDHLQETHTNTDNTSRLHTDLRTVPSKIFSRLHNVMVCPCLKTRAP